jgi:uncharacterized RDD family membrane protein YckC
MTTTFGKKALTAAPPAAKPAFGRKAAPQPVSRSYSPPKAAASADPLAFLQSPPKSPPKPAQVQPVKAETVKPPRPQGPSEAYAGKPVWGRRVLARLVDEFGVWFLISLASGGGLMKAVNTYIVADTGSAAEVAASVEILGYAMVFMVLQSVYNIAMEASSKQATLGKMMVGAVVTARDGSKPGLGSIIMRNTVGRFVSNIIPFYAGYLMGLFSDERRCMHDMMSGTVVRRRAGAPAAQNYSEVFA